MFFTKMSVFLPSKDPPEKFKRVVARSGAFSFLESAKPDRLLASPITASPAPTFPEIVRQWSAPVRIVTVSATDSDDARNPM